MGNVLVLGVVLGILAKILYYLYQTYRHNGTLCTSCTKCVLSSSSSNQPEWLKMYRENRTV